MPVTDAYATPQEYRKGIPSPKSDTSSDEEIERDLLAISRYIDLKCGRFFTRDVAPVARLFYGPASGRTFPEAENPFKHAGKASRMLHLDGHDLVSVSSLKTDDNGTGTPTVLWAPADYKLFPMNNALGPEPRPYTDIFIPDGSSKSGWPTARLIEVTGIWGWPAVPAPIKRGTIQLTGIWRLESPRATMTVNELDRVVGVNKEARDIVRDLIRMYGAASY